MGGGCQLPALRQSRLSVYSAAVRSTSLAGDPTACPAGRGSQQSLERSDRSITKGRNAGRGPWLRYATPELSVAELDGPAREVKLLSNSRRDLVGQRTRICCQVRWFLTSSILTCSCVPREPGGHMEIKRFRHGWRPDLGADPIQDPAAADPSR